MAALLEQIKDHPEYGELHDTLKEAVEKAPEALVAERMRDLDADTEVQATARSFLENVQRHVPQRYALWPEAERQRMVAQHIAAYGDLVDARGAKPDVREFFQRLDIAYAQDPRVQERIKDWREKQAKKREDEIREQVRKELEAERKAADEAAGRDAQQRHRSVRGVSVASRSARDGRRAVEPATEREKLQGLSPSERKRALRQRVVDRGRALQS